MAEGEKPLYKRIDDVRVGDIYQVACGEPLTVKGDRRLHDVVRELVDRPQPSSDKVYVVDGEGRLAGTITLETIMRQVGYFYSVRKPGVMSFFQFMREILKEKASDFMQKEPVSVTKDDRVLEALRLMVEHHLNDLPVVDRKGAVIGELNGPEILMKAVKG